MQRLTRAVYEMLGEDLTRLFYRNLGTAQAAVFLRSPIAEQARERIAQLPTAQRYGWVVQRLLVVAVHGWNAAPPSQPTEPWYTISEDDTAWYLTAIGCTACAGVQGASAPICSWVPTLFSTLAKGYGQRVRVREIACAAMGAPQCVFAIDKAV